MSVKVSINSDMGVISLSDDYYSAFNREGWIDCDLIITVDCFYASLSTQLYKTDLELFMTSIDNCLKYKEKKVLLNTIEEFFKLEGVLQDNGSIQWKGEVKSTKNYSNILYFSFESEVILLSDISVNISGILKRVDESYC